MIMRGMPKLINLPVYNIRCLVKFCPDLDPILIGLTRSPYMIAEWFLHVLAAYCLHVLDYVVLQTSIVARAYSAAYVCLCTCLRTYQN
jgi:hypothetical protein